MTFSQGRQRCSYIDFDPCVGFNPPVVITINYGDGSPIVQWSQENPFNAFGHEYIRSGTYDMSLTVENIYDGAIQTAEKTMHTKKSAFAYDDDRALDIICPTAVEPGTFFTCQLHLLDEEFVKAELIDALSETIEDTTNWIRVPSNYSLMSII